MSSKIWNIYLSGEIHTDWRERVINGSKEKNLPVQFTSAITNHEASDMCGVEILGGEEKAFWQDRKASGINAIRTTTHIKEADVVVVRFGPKYKQWNAAFDAGYAAALNKPLIILHDEELNHPLKEVDNAANATAATPEQVVEILAYITG